LRTDPEMSREVIAARAYEIYLERGRERGHDWDDWLQAEYELRQLPVRELVKLVDAMPRREKPQTKSLLEVVRLAMYDERRAPQSRNPKRPAAEPLPASPGLTL
jgi:Protein of unknown function (DUF2934)